MSNPVFVVGAEEEKNDSEKIVIRFFESSAACFEIDNKVFDIASSSGLSPGLIETDGSTYRVEAFFNGVPFSHYQLQEESTLE